MSKKIVEIVLLFLLLGSNFLEDRKNEEEGERINLGMSEFDGF